MVSVNRRVAHARIRLGSHAFPLAVEETSRVWPILLLNKFLKGDSANASAGLSFCGDTWQYVPP